MTATSLQVPKGQTRRASADRRTVRKSYSSETGERRTTAIDRRAARTTGRQPATIPVDVSAAGMREKTNTLNVSPQGIYFRSAEPFTVGQHVTVTVHGAEHKGEVVRIDRTPGGLHGVAVKYV